MVQHIVLWNFISELSKEEREEAGKKIKNLLESIKELVPGIINMRVVLNEMSSSNRDIALVSTFETVEALKAYQMHPAHVEAGKYIGAVTCNRTCMDYDSKLEG